MSTPFGAATLDRHQRAALLTSIVALSLLAWLALLLGHGAVPHVHPAGPAGVGLAFAMWATMMVGMMLPAVSPWILLFAGSNRRLGAAGAVYFPTALFLAGYLVVWLAFSLAAASLQLFLQRQSLLHGARLALDPLPAGLLWIVAGLFQLTPLKSACLRHCRSPLGFLLANWTPGGAGALRLGLRHGAYCLACCWGLMALSFALGVMNLLWMVALTLFLCVEKIAPGGERIGRLFGVGCVVCGAALVWAG